jgi:hypothetical protein
MARGLACELGVIGHGDKAGSRDVSAPHLPLPFLLLTVLDVGAENIAYFQHLLAESDQSIESYMSSSPPPHLSPISETYPDSFQPMTPEPTRSHLDLMQVSQICIPRRQYTQFRAHFRLPAALFPWPRLFNHLGVHRRISTLPRWSLPHLQILLSCRPSQKLQHYHRTRRSHHRHQLQLLLHIFPCHQLLRPCLEWEPCRSAYASSLDACPCFCFGHQPGSGLHWFPAS